MSLISCELALGDSGMFEHPLRADYVHRFLGRSNNPFDNVVSIIRDRLCPKPGTRDPFDPRAWITSVQPERRDGTALIWDITVQSTTEFNEEDDVHPLQIPAKITPASDQFLTTTRKNARGEWIRNRAGTVIPLEREESRWVFTVEKNVPIIPTALMEMNNKINSGVVFLKGLLLPKNTLMVKGLRGEEQQTRFRGTRVDFLTLFFQLHYNRLGYRVKFPNVDLVELAERSVVMRNSKGRIIKDQGRLLYETRLIRTPILDAEGQPVTEPWPLDQQGKALPRDYVAADLVELEDDVYEETSFDVLPLR